MCCNISLRYKVLGISIGCIFSYTTSVSLLICIILNSKFETMFDNKKEYELFYKLFLSIIILCLCGLMTCILLMFGVLKKKRVLILPFMMFSETILGCVIISELVCDILTPLYGLILLFFIPPIVYTVLTTRSFYNNIRAKPPEFQDHEQEEEKNKKHPPISAILTRY